ncbi:Serine/threonine-protein kinase PAK 6 [Exaiptasia diaphana]|nr:Serine/threonine-protein kinase PAK 6 [Exaiptasia diaphana]
MSFRRLLRRISRRARRKLTRRQDSISLPTNFEHRVHVILDEETGKYVGLPPQWASIMNTKVEGPSTFPKQNGNWKSENKDGKQRDSGVLSPNSLTAMLRSESSV